MREKHERKVTITAGLWDSFKAYKRKKTACPLDRKRYVKICHAINKKLSKKIIEESFQFKIPFRLGTLYIKKNKLKITIRDGKIQKNKMIIDWDATWKYWLNEYPGLTRNEIRALPDKVVIYQTNDHSNGYIMGWYWDKKGSNFSNRSVYKFRTTKFNRLDLAKHIKSEDKENEYYVQKKRINR